MNRAGLLTAFKRWMTTQVPRLERTTMSTVTVEQRPKGFALVATWPATAGGPAGKWEREYTEANIDLAVREVRCKTRRGIMGAILKARGL